MTRSDPPATASRPRAVRAEERGVWRWCEIPWPLYAPFPIRARALFRSSGLGEPRVNGTSTSHGLAGEGDAGMRPGTGEPDRVGVAGGRLGRAEGRDPEREPGRVRLDHQVAPDDQ